MAMTEVELSEDSKRINEEVMALYRGGKIFNEDKSLSKSQEVQDVMHRLSKALATDGKRHLKVTSRLRMEMKVLYNLGEIIELCDFNTCTCHYFLHYEQGYRYLGSHTGTCV